MYFHKIFRQETCQLLTLRIMRPASWARCFFTPGFETLFNLCIFSDRYSTRTLQRTRRNNWPLTLVSEANKSDTGKFLA